jgi:xylulokinase
LKSFLSYDVGTSSVKAVWVDSEGKILATAIEEYPLYMPQPGWVEQNPEDYWSAICKATHTLTAQGDLISIAGIVFTTQAMGIIPVDKDGNILHPNITWVDGRAEEQATKAMNYFLGKKIFKTIVGTEITGKDVIPKMIWLKEKKPEIFTNTYKFLDVNGYLKYKCTGRMVAEWSGACSYAFDVKKKDWERLFFKITKIGTEKLPELVKSTDRVGTLTPTAAAALGLPDNIAVYGGCDDTQSAAVGTTAIGEGEAHIYTGTSAWIGVSTAKSPKFKNGAFCLQSADPTKNIIVGITESAGVNIDWMINTYYSSEKQTLQEQELFALVEKEINDTPPGADYLIVTPWFLGERCPVSTTTTRSTLFNLTHKHTRGHIARAFFEGIAFNLKWSIENIEKDFGFQITSLKITGGGSQNDTWMQCFANILQRTIITTSQPKHAGALGGAVCAMVGDGVLKDFDEIQKIIHTNKTFVPVTTYDDTYNALFITYKNIYHKLRKTYIEANKDRF